MTTHIACHDATVIASTDSVPIVVHDFGGVGPPVLLSHATGFHAHCYEPIAHGLTGHHHVLGLDHRGYGDAGTVDPSTLEWTQYGGDALAAARHVHQRDGTAMIGVGHSMGGASLLMAAMVEPGLFRALVVFEPIVFPPPDPDGPPRPENPLAGGARKRRAGFDSFESALENFASKPPMNSFHPDALAAYVAHGFRPADDGGVTLKCLPEHEARTYETGGTSGAWEMLGEVAVPVWVVSGAPAPFQPSSFAHRVAEQIPGATYVQYDELGHFGPLERPDIIVGLVRTVAATT